MNSFRHDAKRPAAPPLVHAGRFAFRATFLILCMLAGGCHPTTGVTSPQQAQSLANQAEALFDQSQKSAALELMRQAAAADPNDAEIVTRLGELYEIVDQPEAALTHYRKALAMPGLSPALREELHYRCALLCALKLDRLDAAKGFYQMLPKGTRQGDLHALFLLRDGDARGALRQLNTVREMPLEQTMAARVALHAAQAYIVLQAYDEAFALLHQAINLSGRSATARDVEVVWTDLKRRLEAP